MIKRLKKEKPPKKYGNFFLAFEAPGDEEENEDVIEPIEPVEVDPINDDDTDFTNIGFEDDDTEDFSIPSDEEFEDIDEDDTDFTDIGFDDLDDDGEDTGDTIYQDEETPVSEEEPTEDIPEEIPVEEPETPEEAPVEDNPPEETPDTAPEEAPEEGDTPTEEPTEDMDAPVEDDPAAGEETPPEDAGGEEPNPGDEDDFTDIGSDEGSVVGDDAGAGGEENPEEKKGPGLEYDSTRKYNLFKEFQSLYNAINNYISKLENNVRDDMTANRIIKEATDKLREIKSLCYDYMLIKFELSTYTQSLVFYQTLIVAIQTVFRLLGGIENSKPKDAKNKESNESKKSNNGTIE